MDTATAIPCILFLGMIGYILYRGLPHLSWAFLSGTPSLIQETVGILPNFCNTLYLILFTLLLVLPLGIGAAIYLSEYARSHRMRQIITLAAETLSGIPSILYGLVGMLIFVQWLSLGTSLLAGAFTLAIMTLPTILRTTQESLETVPAHYRASARALGAGKWYTIRTVMLPAAKDGIVTGCLLAIGRMIGESAALLFTAGMANELHTLWEACLPETSGATLTVSLYLYAKERGDFDTAFAIAALLLLLTGLIHLAARSAFWHSKFPKRHVAAPRQRNALSRTEEEEGDNRT
jgi:phosphate transport system permease protein